MNGSAESKAQAEEISDSAKIAGSGPVELEVFPAADWVDWGANGSIVPSQKPANLAQKVNDQKSHSILKNDYVENFVLSGRRGPNFVRDSDPTTRFMDYPKLNALFDLKRIQVQNSNTPPRWLKTDLWNFDLRNLGSQFDVILIDPPMLEYSMRSDETFNREFKIAPPGFPPNIKRAWTWDDVAGLNIQSIAAPRSFIFIWIGDGEGLERGRDLFQRWGYRRAEDIVWAKTNTNSKGSYQLGPIPVLQRQKEHCLVGIRGTLRRSVDTHFIHCNVDTDVIISEEPPFGDTAKPFELYTIIENFCLGKRRLELFGRMRNIRDGWLTVGAELPNSNFNSDEYVSWFRNAAVVPFSPDVEVLRPKSPPLRRF